MTTGDECKNDPGSGCRNAPPKLQKQKHPFVPQPEGNPFPFKAELSLAPLVKFWRDSAAASSLVSQEVAEFVLKEVEEAPELLEPIVDRDVIDRRRATIDRLMSIIFPAAFWDRDITAVFSPFIFKSFYATPSFERMFLAPDGKINARANIDEASMALGRALSAYLYVARKFYGIQIEFAYPIIFTAPDPATGLDRHFRVVFDPRFIEVELAGELPPLDDAQKRELMNGMNDLSVWKRLIPPERFAMRGFVLFSAFDVTDQEELSAVKRELIENDSITSRDRFDDLQRQIRTLLRKPDLTMSITALHGDQMLLLNSCHDVECGCIYSDSTHFNISDFAGSIYERCLREGSIQIIDDLQARPRRTALEDLKLQSGYRNVLAAPLFFHDEPVGVLSIASPRPGDLNSMNSVKLLDVLPLFSIAIKRSIEDLNNRVQRIIREEYTAIHPSVEWRFHKAALNMLEVEQRGASAQPEPIVFEDVFPLYSVTDIRGSSTQRNAAIQSDLTSQLNLARSVFERAREYRPLAVLATFVHRIDKQIASIVRGIGAGDESNVLAFLHDEVEPHFEHLRGFGDGVEEAVAEYRAAIDEVHGMLHVRRREYEESVALINRTLSAHVEEEERRAQEIFPHYFEKHETDGIDLSMYVGAALVEDGRFDPLYLKELRLWQLMVTCGLARRTEAIKPMLKVPLETAHLVLVQDHPLTIRFRHDEKQFDVDGAYNIRYEIMKKRIDKATINGSSERLTQPGRIAVVYSHDREAQEYREYLDFLIASGELHGEIEELALDDLQGVQGLRALRAQIVLDEHADEAATVPVEIEQAIKAMAGEAG
jgi:hypothetical protein